MDKKNIKRTEEIIILDIMALNKFVIDMHITSELVYLIKHHVD